MLKELFIISQVKKGDIKAFEQLFRQYYASLCWYATGIVGDREVAEEIIEELFYVIWRDREKLNIFRSTKNYLYTSVWNSCIQYIRQRQREEEFQQNMQQDAPAHTEGPEKETELKELEMLVDSCLQKMPERCRRIFHMHRTEGMKYAEIASELGVSVKTVEAYMSKALKILRKEVETYYKE